MATGYLVLYITPKRDFIDVPDNFTLDFTSDAFTARTRLEDKFVDFDHEPTSSEKSAVIGVGETEEEIRFIDNVWRLRVRFSVAYTTESRGGIVHLYRLSDPKISASWGNAAEFWGVYTTAAKHLQLHNYIATTLGFGPIGGAWAAVDPNDENRFLDHAVQTALGLTNGQQLTRITNLRNALQGIGFTATALSAIVSNPTGKTEDDLVRALVSDLGFTMQDLKHAAMNIL